MHLPPLLFGTPFFYLVTLRLWVIRVVQSHMLSWLNFLRNNQVASHGLVSFKENIHLYGCFFKDKNYMVDAGEYMV